MAEPLKAELPVTTDPALAHEVIQHEIRYAKLGLIVGLGCILLGVIVLILGISGSVNWNINIGGFYSSLTNAAPGIILLVVGFFIICLTRFRIKITK